MTTGLESDIGRTGGPEKGPETAGAWPRRLSTALSRRPSAGAILTARREEIEAQAHRWFLWSPVALGLGAAAYFNLPIEPPVWLAALPALLAVVAVVIARRFVPSRVAVILASLLAFLLAGGLLGKLRTDSIAAPVADAAQAQRRVEGYVVDVTSSASGGGRLVIAPVVIHGMAPERTPKRIRVTIPAGAIVAPGEAISLLAFIGPPPAPASPGAYDFARDAWFDGVGGVGFANTAITPATLEPAPLRLQLVMRINALRWSLAKRIVDVMGAQSGGVAAAMVTGHEVWLTPQQVADMRASGLAHILSISGLHMAIVGGFVFALGRLIVAAWPWLALRAPGKKIAAVAGLSAILLYLLISGWPPPAQRAAITAIVAFGAILVDRPAISLHALAVAALVILTLQPEAACEPGFQMSFAATAALVALAEAWPRAIREISAPWWIRGLQGAGSWLLVSLAASFVAGLATGPLAMQHFNRVATWGLISNLIVAPLSSFVIMPALALGATLAPIADGAFARPFLAVAAWGIEAMTAIAHAFATAPGALYVSASAPGFTLPIAFVGLMWVCLWRGPMRWLGLPLALAVNLWPRPIPPDVWIAGDGAAAAIRVDKRAVLMRPDTRLFAADLWARRRGLTIGTDPVTPSGMAFDCDRQSCRPRAATRPSVAGWWWKKAPAPDQLARLCASAEIVVIRARMPALPAACDSRVVLSAAQFQQGGSAELYRRPDGAWRIVWAQPLRGRRPWTARENPDPAPPI